jgi:hypothetical protein
MKNKDIRIKWELFINDSKYKEYLLSSENSWINILENIKKYIDDNKKKPSSRDEDKKIKYYGNWISHQIRKYTEKSGLMKDEKIRKLWYEFLNDPLYSIYFK